MERVAVVVRSERRRRWSDEEKQRVLREILEPGATVTLVAKRHGVNTGQIYTWRRQALQGAVNGFIPVAIDQAREEPAAPVSQADAHSIDRDERIEIELPNGIRLRVPCDIDGKALRRIALALEGR